MPRVKEGHTMIVVYVPEGEATNRLRAAAALRGLAPGELLGLLGQEYVARVGLGAVGASISPAPVASAPRVAKTTKTQQRAKAAVASRPYQKTEAKNGRCIICGDPVKSPRHNICGKEECWNKRHVQAQKKHRASKA